MSLTLAATINASTRVITVTGTVTVEPGYQFRLGDELLELQGFDRGEHGARNPLNRNRWYVQRAVGLSVAASHNSGTALKGAVDAFVSGSTEAAPNPFPVDGGGGGGYPAVEDDTTTLSGPVLIHFTGATVEAGSGNSAIVTIGDGTIGPFIEPTTATPEAIVNWLITYDGMEPETLVPEEATPEDIVLWLISSGRMPPS